MTEARLVTSPVFILSPIRSGSTLLRCLLNSHPEVYAPHELHLGHLTVKQDSEYVELAMKTLGLSPRELEYMLWDRLLHRLLTASGKRLIVDKSPSNVWIWRRIVECWPQARFIILRRHPAAIAESIVRANDGRDSEEANALVCRFAQALDEASQELSDTFNVTYEELTSAPRETCERLCSFLGVRWEPKMLDYGRFDHGPFVYGIGDWSDRIRSGRVHHHGAIPSAAQIPESLRDLCKRWGYTHA